MYFSTPQGCNRGRTCKFPHVDNRDQYDILTRNDQCIAWHMKGVCNSGSTCRYTHDLDPTTASRHPNPDSRTSTTSAPSSLDVSKHQSSSSAVSGVNTVRIRMGSAAKTSNHMEKAEKAEQTSRKTEDKNKEKTVQRWVVQSSSPPVSPCTPLFGNTAAAASTNPTAMDRPALRPLSPRISGAVSPLPTPTMPRQDLQVPTTASASSRQMDSKAKAINSPSDMESIVVSVINNDADNDTDVLPPPSPLPKDDVMSMHNVPQNVALDKNNVLAKNDAIVDGLCMFLFLISGC